MLESATLRPKRFDPDRARCHSISPMGLRTVAAFVLLGALAATIALKGDGDEVNPAGNPAGTPAGTPASKDSRDALAAPEGAPVRILPGSAAAVDWLAALGIAPGRVVALPVQADRWAITRLTPEVWVERPRYERLTSEVALGFQPDLVLVSPFSDASAVQRIRSGGAEVLNVLEPADWEGLLDSGRMVAAAVGAADSGAQLMESLEARKAALAARSARPLRVLPYGNFGGGGTTSGSGTTLDLALELAGFVNVAAASGLTGNDDLSYEQILSMKFDALLVLGEEDLVTSTSADVLCGADAFAQVGAIRDRRFLVLSEALYAAGSLAILDAAEELARQGDGLALPPKGSSD